MSGREREAAGQRDKNSSYEKASHNGPLAVSSIEWLGCLRIKAFLAESIKVRAEVGDHFLEID
jgi:hypothetical protein